MALVLSLVISPTTFTLHPYDTCSLPSSPHKEGEEFYTQDSPFSAAASPQVFHWEKHWMVATAVLL